MKICPHCGRDSSPDQPNCQHCGKPLQASSGDTTVRFRGPLPRAGGDMRRTTRLEPLFAVKPKLIIGRAADCDLCLAHPMISRHHATLERLPDGRLRLTDLGSINGISVNAAPITEPTILRPSDCVGIGPFLFTASDGQVFTVDSSRSLRLEARSLEKVIRLPGGQKRKLLDNVNLVIEPGEFVSLLGPSGSGKSTLMDCLNGRRWATGGRVLANGEDFYRFFDNFRQSLGYVPQKDIVHTQLTVYRALYYTARLRLPTDTSPNELSGRIEEVIQIMELGPHRATLVANLSGGQIKRVSLGAELLARPCLLYIDEATSGLDAGTEARMMRLFRRLADEGKSLICITHNVDNVDQCHLAIVLARGKLIYYGPPADAPAYFEVRRISEIYDKIGEKDLDSWEKKFEDSAFHDDYVVKRLAAADESKRVAGGAWQAASEERIQSGALASAVALQPAPAKRHRPPLWHQFCVLTTRYAELLWGDRRSLLLLWLQAPVVAIILFIGFSGKPFEATLPRLRNLTAKEKQLLTVLKGIEQDLATGNKANPQAGGDADPQIHLVVDDLKQKKSVKVADLWAMVQKLDNEPLGSDKRKALEKVRLEITSGGVTVPVDLKQLSDLVRQLQQSKLATKLLQTDQTMPVVPDETMVDPTYTYMLLFMLVIIVLWFGSNNAAKEIVKEEAIYGRERAVNLGILPYLSSKFLLLSIITAVQALILMVMLYGALELLHWFDPAAYQTPAQVYRLSYGAQFGVLAILSMTGVALGLMLSACVATPDRANALLPYVTIPQIILGGCIMPVKDGVLFWLAVVFSPVYWAFRAARTGATELPDYTSVRMDYVENPWIAAGAMGVQLTVMLLLTTLLLRRKDVQRV
jgi:ABC-type multidrug transport system ATPase subunit